MWPTVQEGTAAPPAETVAGTDAAGKACRAAHIVARVTQTISRGSRGWRARTYEGGGLGGGGEGGGGGLGGEGGGGLGGEGGGGEGGGGDGDGGFGGGGDGDGG